MAGKKPIKMKASKSKVRAKATKKAAPSSRMAATRAVEATRVVIDGQ